jgi:hypothetical protein
MNTKNIIPIISILIPVVLLIASINNYYAKDKDFKIFNKRFNLLKDIDVKTHDNLIWELKQKQTYSTYKIDCFNSYFKELLTDVRNINILSAELKIRVNNLEKQNERVLSKIC